MADFEKQPPILARKLDTKEKKPSWVQRRFADEVSAVLFIKDFWMHVDPEGVGEKIADLASAGDLREHTQLDRTVLNGLEVTIYRNAPNFPLTDKAIDFLKSKGML